MSKVKEIEVKGKTADDLIKVLEGAGICPEPKEELITTKKMTPAQLKLWADVDKGFDKIKALKKEVSILRKKFWNKIEGDLEIFDKQLKVNTDDNSIEVYEMVCDECE